MGVPEHLAGMLNAEPVQSKWKQTCEMALIVFLYLFIDITKGFVVVWSFHGGKPPYALTTVQIVKDMVCIILGLAFSAFAEGKAGVRQCIDLKGTLRIIPIAFCFFQAGVCGFASLQYFDPGSQKVLMQLNLPATAFFSFILLRKKYSYEKIQAILIIFVACLAFHEVKLMMEVKPQHYEVSGLLYIAGAVFFSVAGSILGEKFLRKDQGASPFYIQKTLLSSGSLLVGLCCVLPWKRYTGSIKGGFFDGWDGRTFVVLAEWSALSWVSSLLVKRVGSVTKQVSQCMSSVLTYAISVAVQATEGPLPKETLVCCLCASLVFQAVVAYGNAPAAVDKKKALEEATTTERLHLMEKGATLYDAFYSARRGASRNLMN